MKQKNQKPTINLLNDEEWKQLAEMFKKQIEAVYHWERNLSKDYDAEVMDKIRDLNVDEYIFRQTKQIGELNAVETDNFYVVINDHTDSDIRDAVCYGINMFFFENVKERRGEKILQPCKQTINQ